MKKTVIKISICAFILSPLFLISNSSFAQSTNYNLLAPLPLGGAGSGEISTANASQYIQGIFMLTIALAGVLAVVMIIFGGIRYMSTDAFSGKDEAKHTIQNAIWGLLLAIGAWLILYTINPNLTTFNLSLTPQPIAAPIGGAGAGGVVGAGCQGNCPYSYVNSSGQTVSYRNCVSCANATSFGLNIKTPTVNGTTAQMNTALGNKLSSVNNTSGNPAFQVTETWPPTVNHKAQGQYDGTSVDVSLSNPNATNINTFINNANTAGLRVVYEVPTASAKQSYINAGVPAGSIITVSGITGEHFSVY